MVSSAQRNTMKTTIQYEPEADVLSVEYRRRKSIDYATEVGNLIVHFSRSGEPVLVEILNASKFTARAHALTCNRTVRKRRIARARSVA